MQIHYYDKYIKYKSKYTQLVHRGGTYDPFYNGTLRKCDSIQQKMDFTGESYWPIFTDDGILPPDFEQEYNDKCRHIITNSQFKLFKDDIYIVPNVRQPSILTINFNTLKYLCQYIGFDINVTDTVTQDQLKTDLLNNGMLMSNQNIKYMTTNLKRITVDETVVPITDEYMDALDIKLATNFALCGRSWPVTMIRPPNCARTVMAYINFETRNQKLLFDVKGVGVPYLFQTNMHTERDDIFATSVEIPKIETHATGVSPIKELLWERFMTGVISILIKNNNMLSTFYNITVSDVFAVIEYPYVDMYSGEKIGQLFREPFPRCVHENVSVLPTIPAFLIDTWFKLWGINTARHYYNSINIQSSSIGKLPIREIDIQHDILYKICETNTQKYNRATHPTYGERNGQRVYYHGCEKLYNRAINKTSAYPILHDMAHYSLITPDVRDAFDKHRTIYPDKDTEPELYAKMTQYVDMNTMFGKQLKTNDAFVYGYKERECKYKLIPLYKYYVTVEYATSVDKTTTYYGLSHYSADLLYDDAVASGDADTFINELIQQCADFINSLGAEPYEDYKQLCIMYLDDVHNKVYQDFLNPPKPTTHQQTPVGTGLFRKPTRWRKERS
jgi:hypothetical protein